MCAAVAAGAAVEQSRTDTVVCFNAADPCSVAQPVQLALELAFAQALRDRLLGVTNTLLLRCNDLTRIAVQHANCPLAALRYQQ
jgi:hypothetical protein